MPSNFMEWMSLLSSILCIIATTSNLIAIRMVIKEQAKSIARGVERDLKKVF